MLRKIPRIVTPIAVPTFPFANSIIATGTQMSSGPSAGTRAKIPINAPNRIANLTPKNQKPIAAIDASKSAIKKVPTRMSLITSSIWFITRDRFLNGRNSVNFFFMLSQSTSK